MPGLGYKAFTTGEVLTAANLQGYAVDQSVMVFDSAADRTTDLASPSQGMVSFLTDSGTTWIYYGLYNASTNPGGATVAGWYPYGTNAIFHGTATRSAANNTSYKIGATGFLYTEVADTLAWHSAVTNTSRITPTVAGVYRVTVQAQQTSNATGSRVTNIFKNATQMSGNTISAATASTASATATFTMNGTTDYIECEYYQNSGISLTVTAQVSVEFIRPTSN